MSQAFINLAACRHNLSVAKQAAAKSKCVAVIKANAYGHGMVKIAHALDDADAFAVARVSEAIELRESGISKPIILLEGFTSVNELGHVVKYKFESVLHSEEQLQLLENTQSELISIIIKVDTGMHRLGFMPEDVADVYHRLNQCQCVDNKIALMTHFANADDKHDEKTLHQIEVFYQSIESLPESVLSLANSAAILGWPQSHASWNRPGIMLYGVSPFINDTAAEHNLKPVMTLKSQLISIKKIRQGEAIGYGGTYICEKDMTVGIVAIGYGDGYPRHAKTGTPVLVNGKRSRLLGRVSMDMICVDLNEHREVNIGAPVILWGESLAIEEIAESAETIAYELLCGVTKRVEFKYID